MRILLAEDERDLNAILVKKLQTEGYSVDACLDGEEALHCLACAEYDAIVLDIMMPKTNGLQVLRHLRTQGDTTPVLFLTARDSIADRVQGLDAGANDYLIKPFSLEELMARIRTMTRVAVNNPTDVFILSNLVVDCRAHSVLRGDTSISLSAREFQILEYLIRNQGIVLSREKIEMHVWNYEYAGGSNVVDVYIKNLRKKIDEGFAPKLIQTLRGSGYALREEP